MRSIIALLAISLVLVSCSKNDPVAPAEPVIKVPGKGSTYTFATYEIDENGDLVPGSEEQTTYSVVATGIVRAGKTGVWAITSGPGGDTLFFSADNANDVWFQPYEDAEGPVFPWMRLPITSGAPGRDSTTQQVDFNGIPATATLIGSTKRIGPESVTVGSSTISTQKIQVDLTYKISVLGMEETFTITTVMFYAPKLGFYAGLVTPPQVFNGEPAPGQAEELTQYDVK